MKELVIFSQIAVFTGYLYYIYTKYGVLNSISESYYCLEKERPQWISAIFTLFIWCIGATMVMLFAIESENVAEWKATPFIISAAAFGFLGAAPKFKIKTESTVHVIGAATAIASAFIALLTTYRSYGFLIAFIVTYIILKYLWISEESREIPNITWWIECAAFVLISLALVTNI